MKNILKIACLFLAVAFTSCYDVMDDKAAVEAGWAQGTAPTVTTGATTVHDFSSFTATGSVSAVDQVLEVGFMVDNNASFSNATLYPAESVSSNFSATVSGVKDNTTYHVRSYAYTKGSGTVLGEAVTAVLPKAPEFADTYLFGTYAAQDIDVQTGQPDGGAYAVKIAQKDGLWNKVNITNIWGGGMTIEGTVDFETKTITTKANSIIYLHSSYGDVWCYGLDLNTGATNPVTIATYDDKGNVQFGPYAALCEAGVFGYYVTQLVKQ